MLESIRNGVQKPWVKVVVFAIVISFIFAGYFTTSFFGDPNAVATVNGDSISRNEFQRAYLSLKSQQADYYNATVKTEEDERNFQESVLQRLINIKVKDQALEELGMRFSSTALRDKIQSDPNYQIDGKYSSGLVDQALVATQRSRESFKIDYANQEVTRQLLLGLSETDFALPGEAQNDFELISQTRSGRALQINFAQFKQNVTPTEEEINQYYQDNQEAFRVEEKVSIEYIELSMADLQSQQEITDEEAKLYYDENIDRYKADAQRQIAHILVLHNDDESASLAKAEALKTRIDNGEDFAAIVATESDDIPTRETGGDLGVLLPGAMEPEIESAANDLVNVGDISAPVRTDFGYHIVKLTNFVEGSVQPFDDVKAEIVSELQKTKADEIFYAKSQDLESWAFEVSDSLAEASAQTGLEIKVSPFFGQSSRKDIFANQALKNAAFSSDVKDSLLNSAPVEIGENHIVVLRLKESQPSRVQTLEEVKARVENSVKQAKAKNDAEQLADNLLGKLKAKEDVEALLSENQLTWTDLDKVQRNNASMSFVANQQFFKMPAPSEGNVTWDKVEDFQGITILMLNKVEKGDWAAADDANKNQRTLYIGSYFANAGFSAFLEDRRKESKVTRNLQNLPQ
ncbi:hypothetical protein FLL45_10900 [Aliikangiella marina]|uniref:Periplasmic chaperone PpiD n=1 Tax=Aliikangiella marina TaxID=1712262 RepID=A0A545TDX4_9GAMM|nr:SurA N-terminal domain-containing protein [Aliikangiella marina]TQV75423.1 hypothetical protein FLL45_10900 [Aliikangiella marina]